MVLSKALSVTRRSLIPLACLCVLSACSTYNSTGRTIAGALTPYRIDIVQGNVVSSEAAAQLKVGMEREQVRYWLGTPLLADMFHDNRWDYVFTFKRGGSDVVQQRRYSVYFENNKLVKFGGDPLPSEYELVAEIDGLKAPKKTDVTVSTPAEKK